MNLSDRFLVHPRTDLALVGADWSLTYGELDDSLAGWRGGLASAGVVAGDRVAIVAGNEPTFVLAHLAIVGLGAASVPLNPQAPAAELNRALAAVAPRCVVMGAGVATHVGDALAAEHSLADPDTLAQGERVPVTPVEANTAAVLLFTSGTAGMPRPAILTHGNLAASLDALAGHSSVLGEGRHVLLAVIPLFHVFGLNAVLHLGLALGAAVVVEDHSSAERVAELVETKGVTVLGGPPTLWRQLADQPGLGSGSFEHVVLAVSGAAKLSPCTAVAVSERLGLTVVEGYGLTETCAAVASGVGAGAPLGSIGRLLPGVEARIVDAAGGDALVGDPGELWVRGPMVSPGFYQPGSPVDDGAAIAAAGDGWLRTGDVAVVDDEGYLAIVDRAKDIVIVSGFNVYPGEVEAVLRAHPDVAEAAVVGRHDDVTGERVVAFVVLSDAAAVAEDSLVAHCRAHLARYKIPASFEIRHQLPTGIAGKLRRRELD